MSAHIQNNMSVCTIQVSASCSHWALGSAERGKTGVTANRDKIEFKLFNFYFDL